MNKLVKLHDGPWIRSDQIVQISEPYQDAGQWCYSVAYKSEVHDNMLLFHVARLSNISNIIHQEERAYESAGKMANKINEHS